MKFNNKRIQKDTDSVCIVDTCTIWNSH